MQVMIFFMTLYGNESWTLNKVDRRSFDQSVLIAGENF